MTKSRRSLCQFVSSSFAHSFVIRHPSFVVRHLILRMSTGSLTCKSDETKSLDLPRRHLLLVFLGATRLGRVEETLRRPGRFRMEDRVDGRIGVSEIS